MKKTTQKYRFTLHDSGGRVIERFEYVAATYEEAYKAADARAAEINSHGVTRCNANWRPM